MNDQDDRKAASRLRTAAEAAASQRPDETPEALQALHSQDIIGMLHELRVHQIELEMQNDELRRVQQELESTKAHYLDLFHLAPVGYFTLDGAGRIVQANLKACNMLRAVTKDLLASSFTQFISPQSQDAYYLRCRRNTEIGQNQPLELRMNRADGTSFWADLVMNDSMGEDGTFSRRITLSDISARKLAEEQLSLSAHAMAAISQGVLIAGRDLILTYVNDAFLNLTGYSREECLGRTCAYLQGHLTDATTIEKIRRGLATGTGFSGEILNYRKDGSTFWNELTITPLRNPAGEIMHFVGIVRDISQRRAAEATRLALEAQLRESQKLEAIGTLAGGIAHDFNNLLAVILGNLEMARKDSASNPRVLESLDHIARAGSRGRELVQQILSFSRRQSTDRKSLHLAAVVEDARKLMRLMIPSNIQLNIHCAPDTPPVWADAVQMEQIVINLVSNAVQAMQATGGRIDINLDSVALDAGLVELQPELRSVRAASPECVLRLSVTDNGPGMTEETARRVFEPFFTTKRTGEGTGLGLSVVHGIAKAHQGAILVNSEPGRGTRFTLYLPAIKAVNTDEVMRHPESPPVDQATGPNHEHILYIDDDEALVSLVVRLLGREGFKVSGFVDYRDGLAALEADPGAFDLVLTDYNMPGMSGLEVVRRVRELRPELAVAIATGYIDDTLRAQASETGLCEVIFKPNAVQDFCNIVKHLIADIPAPPGAPFTRRVRD